MTDINSLLRHELSIQRVATSLINKGLFANLDQAYAAVRSILLNAETITNERQLNAITRAITKAINESMTQGWATYSSELGEVAIFDASFYAQNIGAPVVPPANTIQSFIDSALMSLSSGQTPQVGVWADFVRKNIDGLAEQVNNLVKAGYINGATVNQISRTIKQFNDGLAKQQAETLARTGLRHYTEQARNAMVDANKDIIDRRYYLSVFDNRRTIICINNHGKVWDIDDENYVRLPAHYACRSIYLYLLKGQGLPDTDIIAIGAGKNYPDDAAKKPVYKGRKDSRSGKFEVEQISFKSSPAEWLKAQGEAFVIDNLGATKAKLFLQGKLPLERMSDMWNKPLTVEEIIRRNPDAAKRAGLLKG